jgi:drug/metabolite transporter (DMT)-like permease
MFSYIWPVSLLVLSNILYQICAKSVPSSMNPFASLVVTYSVGIVASIILYFALNRGGNFLGEFSKVNWAPIVLGLVIVGLEVGSIYAYKAGWPISVMQIVQSSFLAVGLLFIGFLVYHEVITLNKVIGMVVCLAGLAIINSR